jgi:hypothetical protein
LHCIVSASFASHHVFFHAVCCYANHAAAIPPAKLQNSRWLGDSSRGAGDVEPLVNRRVDGGGGLLLVLGDVEGRSLDAVVAVLDEGVGTGLCVSYELFFNES